MDDGESFYAYPPSTTAAVLFTVFFGVGAMVHTYQLFHYRAYYFIPFLSGAIMMTIGYIFRIVSIRAPTSLAPYIVQSLCLILPPSLYAATIYMIYGRLVRLTNAAHLSLIRPSWVTKLFVTGDVIAFLIQAGGGGMLTNEGNETLGKNILLVGLFVQLAFFGFFIVVSAVFNYRLNKAGGSAPGGQNGARYHWSVMMMMLYVASVLIIVRCIFRVIEFSQGEEGNLRSEEVWMYCFDAAPMVVVQSVFNLVHGGMVVPRTGRKNREEEYELGRERVRGVRGRGMK